MDLVLRIFQIQTLRIKFEQSLKNSEEGINPNYGDENLQDQDTEEIWKQKGKTNEDNRTWCIESINLIEYSIIASDNEEKDNISIISNSTKSIHLNKNSFKEYFEEI